MNMPRLPAQTSPFLWGAVSGAIALAVVGFNWGGWMTGTEAEKRAVERADQALVSSLVPMCVAQFQKGPEARARLAAFKEVKSWEQGDYVSSGGWATVPGSKVEPNRIVAQACAEEISKM
jgi:hypothetical protein